MDSIDLTGRVAVVTGGASGIGRATALLLARHGAQVTVGDYRPDPANESLFAEHKITQDVCNVRVEQDLKRLIDGAAERGRRLDILVSNAGVVMVKAITEVSEEDWDTVLDTNLKGAFFGAKHAIRHMLQCGGGSIINTASNAGLLPRAHDPVYSISKLAVVGLTKSLALCHAPDRIRVNCVCPGPVSATSIMDDDLDQYADRQAAAQQRIDASPLAQAYGRMMTPEEVAQSILYLASDLAVMVTGTAIAIDGGKSLGVPPAPKNR